MKDLSFFKNYCEVRLIDINSFSTVQQKIIKCLLSRLESIECKESVKFLVFQELLNLCKFSSVSELKKFNLKVFVSSFSEVEEWMFRDVLTMTCLHTRVKQEIVNYQKEFELKLPFFEIKFIKSLEFLWFFQVCNIQKKFPLLTFNQLLLLPLMFYAMGSDKSPQELTIHSYYKVFNSKSFFKFYLSLTQQVGADPYALAESFYAMVGEEDFSVAEAVVGYNKFLSLRGKNGVE